MVKVDGHEKYYDYFHCFFFPPHKDTSSHKCQERYSGRH